jgi:uncharacterized membrane protein YgdD (TMEM256/DUF423 family)
MTPDSSKVRLASVLGLLGVVLGAAGAHGRIHDLVSEQGHLAEWATAVDYHLLHAGVLLLVGAMGPGLSRFAGLAWRLMLFGVLLFSGSLYAMGVTGIKWLGAITPLGGLCLMAGWLFLALGAGRKPSK